MPQRTWLVPEGCLHVAGRDALTAEQLRLAERLAYRDGEGYDSYLLLERGLQYFFGSDGHGVVGFNTWRRHIFVVGGLMTPRIRRARLLKEFLNFARINRYEVNFINVLASDAATFRNEGFSISKVGEEPVVPLSDDIWRGADFTWVRRQENFCLRNEVVFEEIQPDPTNEDYVNNVIPELEAVSHEHLSDTVYGRELSMMVGQLDLRQMFRRRLFVARKDGQAEAFVIANPAQNGNMWAVETYRKRPTATRGVIPFLISQIARQLNKEDVKLLSLCQVPALRASLGTASDSRFVTKGLDFWWRYLPWFYDTPRQYHFKSRFRPQYRECFVASYPKVRTTAMLAFFFKWGIIVPDLKRLPQQMLRRMSKWKNQEQLANPAEERYVLYQNLDEVVSSDAPITVEMPTSKEVNSPVPLVA